MNNEILDKKQLSENTFYFKIHNRRIANKRLPGQFLILRVNEGGERIPLTIAGSNKEEEYIEIFFQVLGATTKKLSLLNPGDVILDIAGPLGIPSEIENYGNVLCVAGGIGTAVVYPTAKALKEKGNKLISIEGARNKNLMILEKELKDISDEFFPCTDDGSYGEKGLVTDVINRLLNSGYKFDICYAVGPVPMMAAVCNLTKKINLKTVVSLNPIMVDGTGMCGGCRVSIDGKIKFACIEGPEFDGHKVDFKELSNRLKFYKNKEQFSTEQLEKHICKLIPTK